MPAQTIYWHKELRSGGAASQAFSTTMEATLWQYEGGPCHGSVPPTSAANPDNTTAGSLMQTSPSAGKTQWLHSLTLASVPTGGRITWYDRLAHISGLVANIATTQTVSATVSRWGPAYTGSFVDPAALTGEGNEIFIEIYTVIGTTATTVTAQYVNQAGVTKTTQAVAFGGTNRREVDRVIRLPLAVGDTGVRSVTTVTVLATTGTAGNFGVVIARRIAEFVGAGFAPELFSNTFDEGGAVEILAGACITATFAPVGAVGSALTQFDAIFTLVDN